MHAHARAIVLTYAHALDLTHADAITHMDAADPDLIGTLDLAGARDLARAIAGDLASAIYLARTRAVEFVGAIDADRSVLSVFDFDIDDAINRARVHGKDLERAELLTRSIANDYEHDLARVFGLTGVRIFDPALPIPGVLGLSVRWIANGRLARTLLEVLAEISHSAQGTSQGTPSLPGDLYRAFALALSSQAGIRGTTQVKAALGYPVTDALRDLEVSRPRKGDDAPDQARITGIRRLTDACVPMCGTHEAPSPPEAAAIRAVALSLADSATVPGSDAPDVLRTVAATVTLIENRSKGDSKRGESVILALA
jgi:hypothetical protein